MCICNQKFMNVLQGRWFNATIAGAGARTYTVNWCDGDPSHRVVPEDAVHGHFAVGAPVRAKFHDGNNPSL